MKKTKPEEKKSAGEPRKKNAKCREIRKKEPGRRELSEVRQLVRQNQFSEAYEALRALEKDHPDSVGLKYYLSDVKMRIHSTPTIEDLDEAMLLQEEGLAEASAVDCRFFKRSVYQLRMGRIAALFEVVKLLGSGSDRGQSALVSVAAILEKLKEANQEDPERSFFEAKLACILGHDHQKTKEERETSLQHCQEKADEVIALASSLKRPRHSRKHASVEDYRVRFQQDKDFRPIEDLGWKLKLSQKEPRLP
ncbi:MAG: hypothetical protein MK135_12805 [Polyangiaceae bacterium]|nr:hypothetical protein [Polyangiaceae bacterium]